MKVQDIMSTKPLSVDAEEFVTHARELMRDNGFQSLPVLRDGKYQGVITAQDIVNVTSTKSNVTVDGYIRWEEPTVAPTTDLARAARTIIGTDTGRVAVVDGGRLVGILSVVDLFKGIEELGLPDVPVRDVMHREFTVVTPDEPISEAWRNMTGFGFRGFPVVRMDQTVIGVITREDVLKRGYVRFERESQSIKTPSTVQMAMSTPAVTVDEDDSVRKAAQIFMRRDIRMLPVLKDGRLTGVMDRRDVLKVCGRLIAVE